jgi:hypothetical protein
MNINFAVSPKLRTEDDYQRALARANALIDIVAGQSESDSDEGRDDPAGSLFSVTP